MINSNQHTHQRYYSKLALIIISICLLIFVIVMLSPTFPIGAKDQVDSDDSYDIVATEPIENMQPNENIVGFSEVGNVIEIKEVDSVTTIDNKITSITIGGKAYDSINYLLDFHPIEDTVELELTRAITGNQIYFERVTTSDPNGKGVIIIRIYHDNGEASLMGYFK